MKKHIISLGLAITLAVGAVTSVTAESTGLTVAGVRIANPFDSSTWWDGASDQHLEETETIAINFADPDFWMSIPSVEKHSVTHKALLNPATWAQFAKPETYANMMDPEIWVKWAQPKTYAVFFDPQTYIYRMQPGAFLHILEPHHYEQLINPAAYGEIWDTASETVKVAYIKQKTRRAVASLMD